jgi:hypothetical protein
MALPNFWELAFRTRHPDSRTVADAYRAFTERCWPYEVQVHHIARHKLKKWLEENGWMGRTCHDLLNDLGYDSALRRASGMGQGSGANRVFMAMLMFLAWVLATRPEPSEEDLAAFYRQFESKEGA